MLIGFSGKKDGRTNQREGASCSSSAAASSQPEDLGIIRHSGPANPKYSTVEARTRTFREWPPALRQQPGQLSEAGFFYIGLSDQGIKTRGCNITLLLMKNCKLRKI